MSKITEGGFLITKIHHLAGRIFSKKLKEFDIQINPGQGRILFALWRGDGISINDLAGRTALGKSTLTDMLDRLEESGYLQRTPSQKDRRKTLITLTEKTARLHQKYNDVSILMSEVFYDGFSSGEISEFEEYLRRLLDNLMKCESE
ncbi:MAG: MarR family winged helix-turn-helix transcriptional regulator [Candidatus Thorarchaeota archaeon]